MPENAGHSAALAKRRPWNEEGKEEKGRNFVLKPKHWRVGSWDLGGREMPGTGPSPGTTACSPLRNSQLPVLAAGAPQDHPTYTHGAFSNWGLTPIKAFLNKQVEMGFGSGLGRPLTLAKACYSNLVSQQQTC